MPDSCRGKVALVTGASRGIGAAIAERFAAEGAYVIITARSLDSGPGHLDGTLNEVLAAIRASGGDGIAIQADLTSAESRAAMVERIGRDVGAVDILVNNAAAAFYMPFTAFSASRLRVASAINFEAPWDLCQRLVPGMRARGRGWILNLTSYAGDMPRGTPPFDAFHQSGGALLYGATKAALNRFTAGLAAELYADNIVVNALAPLQMVITPGVKAMGIDKSSPGVVVEPVEAMAEAALALCTSGVDGLNGRIARSLLLLQELKRPAPAV
jgi:citronellol/citronellal dehydrogenase